MKNATVLNSHSSHIITIKLYIKKIGSQKEKEKENISYHIILYIIKVGLRRHDYATWLHQIAKNLLNF